METESFPSYFDQTQVNVVSKTRAVVASRPHKSSDESQAISDCEPPLCLRGVFTKFVKQILKELNVINVVIIPRIQYSHVSMDELRSFCEVKLDPNGSAGHLSYRAW